MKKLIQKIDKQIPAVQAKIDALSGSHLTNTWKRQQEQQERDRKKDILREQLQVLQYLRNKAEAESLSSLEQNLVVSAFYEDMRCFSASRKYSLSHTYLQFMYPRPDDARVKRLQKAGIHNTEELVAAVEQYDALLQTAATPPDKDAIRLRDLLYKAQLCQRGDIQFTPTDVAREMVAIADICAGSRILEPEAGIGNIADAAKEITAQVDCIERMADFREILQLKKHHVISDDLLETPVEPVYDAVLMNPPFSAECEHIQKALEFVRPGGCLVAICSNSIRWKSTRKYEQFREWLAQYGGCAVWLAGLQSSLYSFYCLW